MERLQQKQIDKIERENAKQAKQAAAANAINGDADSTAFETLLVKPKVTDPASVARYGEEKVGKTFRVIVVAGMAGVLASVGYAFFTTN